MGFRTSWLLVVCTLLLTCSLAACGDDDTTTDMVGDASDTGQDSEINDPCLGLVTCEEAGTICEGDTLFSCVEDANGCIVRDSNTDCAAVPYGLCDDSSGVAECAVNHPCDTISNCTTLGTTCDGDSVVSCVEDDLGCFVERRNDCTTTGLKCTDGDEGARCGYDPCANISAPCFAPTRSCEGDVLTICEPNVYGCLEQKVYDCAGIGSMCSGTGDQARCEVANACPTVAECIDPGTSCSGTALDMCRRDEYGCKRSVTAHCEQTSVGAGFCLPETETRDAVCTITFNEQCEGIDTCTVAGQRCVGDELVSCGPNEEACLEESRVDCTTEGDICIEDEQGPRCVDPCSLVAGCPAELFCDGSRMVTCEVNENGCLGEVDSIDCATSGMVCSDDGTTVKCEAPPVITGSSAPSLPVPSDQLVMDSITLTEACTVGTLHVGVNITHSYIADLIVTIRGPGGSPSARLHNGGGGGNNDIIGTYPDTLAPTDSLATFNGTQALGTWTLEVEDTVSLDDGVLNSWDITINCQ